MFVSVLVQLTRTSTNLKDTHDLLLHIFIYFCDYSLGLILFDWILSCSLVPVWLVAFVGHFCFLSIVVFCPLLILLALVFFHNVHFSNLNKM